MRRPKFHTRAGARVEEVKPFVGATGASKTAALDDADSVQEELSSIRVPENDEGGRLGIREPILPTAGYPGITAGTIKVPSNYHPDTITATIQVSTNHHPGISPLSSRNHPDDDQESTRNQQPGNRDTIEVPTGYQRGITTPGILPFSMLVGLQRKVVLVVYESARCAGGQVSQPMSLEYIRETVSSTAGAVKVAIHRLKDKRVLATEMSKKCRGGWTRYRMADAIYLELQKTLGGQEAPSGYHQGINQVPIGVSQQIPKSLVGRLDNNNVITHRPTHLPELDEYRVFIDDEFLQELAEAGFIWTERDLVWAFTNAINPRVLAISLQHFGFDVSKGVIASQGVKSYTGWFKGALKKHGTYYSEGYAQMQVRRKAVEANYLATIDDESCASEKDFT